jgi:YVTN family beta-propeller protein
VAALVDWTTFTPDGKTLYITNVNLKLVTAIDVKTMKVVANIPIGEGRAHVATMVIP